MTPMAEIRTPTAMPFDLCECGERRDGHGPIYQCPAPLNQWSVTRRFKRALTGEVAAPVAETPQGFVQRGIAAMIQADRDIAEGARLAAESVPEQTPASLDRESGLRASVEQVVADWREGAYTAHHAMGHVAQALAESRTLATGETPERREP